MQPNFINLKTYQISNLQASFLVSFKRASLLIILFCLFFFAVQNQIKAQIFGFSDENDATKISSLMNASISNDVPAVSFFIKSNPAAINQQNIGGATALHIAARKGNLEIAKILIKNGADVNAVDNEGWTPLMRAITSQNLDLVKMLLDNGANAVKLNSASETSIVISASSGCGECLKQILTGHNFVNNLNIKILNNQLDDAMKIARNKNDLATQSILTEYINTKINNPPPMAESINIKTNSNIANEAIVSEQQLPELMQNSKIQQNNNHFSNKTNEERRVVIFKLNDSRNAHIKNKPKNKTIFIFNGNKSSSSQYTLDNKSPIAESKELKTYPSSQNSNNPTKSQYKFLGKVGNAIGNTKLLDKKQSVAKQLSKDNFVNKADKDVIQKASKLSNGDKKIFIFNGNKSSSSQYTLDNKPSIANHKELGTRPTETYPQQQDNLTKRKYKFLGKVIKSHI